MSFAINQMSGYGTPSELVPKASLDWNFLSTASLTDSEQSLTLDFDRHTQGVSTNSNTYYWNSSGVYKSDSDVTTPQWDYDPVSLDFKGLLINGGDYEGGTANQNNKISYSYELNSNSWWVETNVTMTTGLSSPDTAGDRAIRFTASVTNGQHKNLGSNMSGAGGPVGSNFCYCIHVKNENSVQRYVMLEVQAGSGNLCRVVYDSINHVITDNSGTMPAYGVTEVADDWWQVWMICTVTTSDVITPGFYLGDGDLITDHTGSWSGDASNGILFWLAGINQRDYVVNPSEVSGGQNNNQGDHLRIATSSISGYSFTEGTLYFEAEIPANMHYNAYFGGIGGSGHSSDYFYIGYDGRTALYGSSEYVVARMRNGAADTYNASTAGLLARGQVNKVAISWKDAGTFLISANGTTVSTGVTNCDVPEDVDQDWLYLGALPWGSGATNYYGIVRGKAWHRRCKYWNSQLTQEQLNSLTAL